jgi:hypothetical protein
MGMDGQNFSKTINGGNSSAHAIDLNDILADLDGITVVLFAQGFYKLTSNLSLPKGVSLVIEGDATIDGGGYALTVDEVSVSAAVAEFTLSNITLAGGLANGALLSISAANSPLNFNASNVTLEASAGSAALGFERILTGTRDITLKPAGDGEAVPGTGPSFDLGSGFETTILPKVYQELQGKIALTKGLIDINSALSFKSASITITDPRAGDSLTFVQDAQTLATLLRVTLDYNAKSGVLSITPAEGRLLNASIVELLLEAVRFENTTTQPGTSRTFTYELIDKDGGMLTASAILLINDLNEAPALQLNAIDDGWDIGAVTATFVQGGEAVDITSAAGITLTDAEDDAINFVTVRITDAVDTTTESLLLRSTVKEGDLFGLSPTQIAEIAGIIVTYDAADATLTLTASGGLLADDVATTDLFEYLLNEVKYANTSANPAVGGNKTRTIEVIAKDTLNENPQLSQPLTFTIDIEADDLDPINAATNATEMREAIQDTPDVAALLDGGKFTGLTEPRQDALLLDLVENKPGGYTAYTQFSNVFFAPLADAYYAIRLAVTTPTVATIQAALDALPETLTLSGEPGLDKATLQAQLDTFNTLNVLKQPILDAVAEASGIDSLVGLVAAAVDLAPDIVVAQVNAAITPAGIQAILADVFVYASGGAVVGYTALQAASKDFAALALLQGKDAGYANFTALEIAFTAAVALGAAGEAFVAAANAGNVTDLIAAAEAASSALANRSIDAFDKDALDAAILAFKALPTASQTAVANDLKASATGTWSLADLYASNLLALTGALVEFRVATAAAVAEASDSVLTFGKLEAVADELADIAAKMANAKVNGTDVTTLATGAATQITRLTALSDNRLKAVLEDVSVGTFASFEQLSVALNTVLVPREAVQTAVTGLVAKANGDTGLAVADFQSVQTALQAIVDAGLRETLTNGTPVEDISAADLGAAITLFGALSPKTQTATLAAVQAGDGYNTLGDVLDAVEPAIRGILLAALNAAANTGDVLAVLDDAAKLYPADFAAFNGLKTESQTFAAAVLLANKGYETFDGAVAVFGQSVALAEAAEAFLKAANAADVAGLSAALGAALTAIGDLKVPGALKADIAAAKAALDDLATGRDQAAANDLKANGGTGWTLSDLYTSNLLALAARLVEFRVEIEDAVGAAQVGTFARGDVGTLEGVLIALEAVAAQRSDATINSVGIDAIIGAKEDLIARVKALAPDGRFDAFAADIAQNSPYSSFTNLISTLEPLLQFREAVQAAVAAGKAGTLGVAELADVQTKLAALDGKKVNGETVDEGDVNTAFSGLIGRVNDLEKGRLVALQNDLEANGASFASFEGMIGLFDGLLTFREAVQDAVTAGSGGTLALADIVAITTALEALPLGTLVNNTAVAAVIAGQEELQALLGDDQLDTGRFAALVADLDANSGAEGFASYTVMVTLLQPLAEFRIELGEAIAAATAGEFTRGKDGTLEGVLAALKAVAGVKSDATINGQDIGAIITAKEALIARVDALTQAPQEPRFEAFVQDLRDGAYSSFTTLVTQLDTVLAPREAVQAAVNAVVAAASGDPVLTVKLFEDVRDALEAVEEASLTMKIGGASVEDTDSTALSSALTTFAKLSTNTQEDVLAEVQTGIFTTLGGVLDAFPAALDKVGLALVNGAATETELLDALADIAVYVTDNAALNSVLELSESNAPRAEALAKDFLLNRGDVPFTNLADAGALLAKLEDVYSGLSVKFDADLFTLGTKGAGFFTLKLGADDSVKLGNIGSVEFADKTAHVVGNGPIVGTRAAINLANNDDVILLSPGTHDITEGGGAPTFAGHSKTGLTFLGAGQGVTIIEGNARVANLAADGGRPTGMTLEGMTLSYENASGYIMQWGTTNNVTDLTLRDVTFTGTHIGNTIVEFAPYSDVRDADGLTLDGVVVSLVGSESSPRTTHFLFGQGDGITIKDSSFAGTFTNAVNLFTSNNVVIEGNTFGDGNASQQSGVAVTLSQTSGTVSGNTFKDGGFLDLREVEAKTVAVSGNTFTLGNGEFGILLRVTGTGDPQNVTIAGNTFTLGDGAVPVLNTLGTIYAFGVNTVAGKQVALTVGTNSDDIIASAAGDQIILAQGGTDKVTFSGNLADYIVSISNGVITVTDTRDTGGQGTNTLTGVEAIKFADGFAVLEGLSIQTAIDLASVGDTINVLAGLYEETIIVNKAVNLVGPYATTAGHAVGRSGEAVIGGKVTISADGASLAGFTLTKAAANTLDTTQLFDTNFLGWDMNSVLVTGDGVTLSNNIIEVFGGQTGKSGFVQLAGATIFSGNVVKAGSDYDAANDARGASAVWINADTDDAVTVSNNHLLVSTNIATPNDADAIYLNNAGAVVIDANLMKGTDGGFVAYGNYGTLTITNNIIEDYAKAGLRIFQSDATTKPDVVVSGNTVSDGGTGAIVFVQGAVKLGSDGSNFLALADNFTGIPAIYRANDLDGNFGVFANGALSLLSTEAAAKTAAGATGVIWSFADAQFLVFDGMSIQAAVNAAEAGDTIVVDDGSYGPVTLDKGVTLVAAADASPTITGAGVNQGAAVRVADGVDGVSITGFTIEAGAVDLAAVYLVSSNAKIALTDNTITGGAAHAVLIGGKSDDVTLSGNTISGDGPLPVVYALGVASLGALNPSSNVSLIDNTITGNPGAGLLVGLESDGGVVQGNTFSGSASYAALELFGSGVTVGGTEEGEPNIFGAFPRVIIDANGNYTLSDLLANNTFATPEIALIRNADTGNIYNSLAEAFGDAQSGETVKISAGVLDLSSEGRLTVPAGVILTGAGLGESGPLTTLKGGLLELAPGAKVEGLAFVDYDARTGGGEPVVLVSGAGATVAGSTFTVVGVGIGAYGTELLVTGNNATIIGNIITRDVAGDVPNSSIGNPGISVDGVGKITITGNTLERAIIGVVTAASGVDLTITGNTITSTVVSNDAIFVTGPGFGNIPDGSAVNIGGNDYKANGNGVLLGLQLRGTATDGFNFTDFGTLGNDFFQGGSGADTFRVSGGNDLLDGGAGVDTVRVAGSLRLSDFKKGNGSDVTLTFLGDDTLRNIERLEFNAGSGTEIVSLVADTGFSIKAVGTSDRPDLYFADGSLQYAVGRGLDESDLSALTLGGATYGDLTLYDVDFTLNVAGNSTLGNVNTGEATLTLTGAGVEVALGTVSGTLNASALTFGVSATAAAGSKIIGGEGQDVITIDADFNAATFAVVTGTDGSSVTVTVGDDVYTLSSVEKLEFNNGKTVYIAGVGSKLSVQGAVNAATSGDSIFVAGAFTEVVTVPAGKALDIFGTTGSSVTGAFLVNGNGTSIADLSVTGGTLVSGPDSAAVYVAADNVELSGLVLTGSGAASSRGILTASGKGKNLVVEDVTATNWFTGIYLNPGATGALVTGGIFTGNSVGMSIDGNDGVTLTGNTFGGTDEDLGLGAAGIASATGNDFQTGKFGNFTVGVVTLGANKVAGTDFDSIKLGTPGVDSIAIGSGGNELVIGGDGLDTATVAAGIDLMLTGFGLDGGGRIKLSYGLGGDNVTGSSTFVSVEQVSVAISPEEAAEFGSVDNAGGNLLISFVAGGAFPVKLEGTAGRPDLFFNRLDLPAVMAAAARDLTGEAVTIVLSDQASYPGVIDLTGLVGGFNATSIKVQRDGDTDVFIGPVFVPQDKTVTLDNGVKFANAAPQLANVDTFVAAAVDESVTGAPYGTVSVEDLNTLFRDDDVGSTLAGIALTGIEAHGVGIVAGRWQFKTAGDAAFRDILTVLGSENVVLGENAAMLLANTTQLRFVPDAATDEDRNFGRVPELSFVAVDSTQALIDGGRFTTSGRLRTTDVSESGGNTAYSKAVAKFSQAVTALSTPADFNTVDNALVALAEDVFTDEDGSFSDVGGDTVADIFGLSFGKDGDKTDLKGVVIVANASVASKGVWQYKAPDGDWVDVGAVSASSALFLASDADLRFVPNWNFNGAAPELSVRGVADATGLTTGGTVNVSGGGGLGTNFSLSVATLGVSVSGLDDRYTFGDAVEGAVNATFNFEGNPGSVFTYNELPVISLLNFDRDGTDVSRDLIQFDFAGLSGAPVVVNAFLNQSNSAGNVLLFNSGTTVTEQNVADIFVNAGFATGKTFAQFFPDGFFETGGKLGAAIGIFQQVDQSVALWYTSELNPAAFGTSEYVKLGYFAGADWSLSYQGLGDNDTVPAPTVSLAELQQFLQSDFAFI